MEVSDYIVGKLVYNLFKNLIPVYMGVIISLLNTSKYHGHTSITLGIDLGFLNLVNTRKS